MWLAGNQIEEITGMDNCTKLDVLNLTDNYIHKIGGLYSFPDLEKLYLSGNKITEIKGLEALGKLETLDLGDNQIGLVKGLESLMNLKDLWINGNPINPSILDKLGGLDPSGCAIHPIKFVEYSLINL